MISPRKLRDAAFAVLLAIPTLAMTRPDASEAQAPAADAPPVERTAMAAMTVDEKRTQLPAQTLN